jgi:hypothetical protein
MVAVGMPVSGHPPDRSQRPLLTHWAPASDHDAQAFRRIGMENVGIREPSACRSVHSRPGDSMPIAASAQRPTPQAEDLPPEGHEHRALVTGVWFAAPLDLLSSCHARLSIPLLLPSKTQILPRFWPLFRHDYEQSHALDLVRPPVLRRSRQGCRLPGIPLTDPSARC